MQTIQLHARRVLQSTRRLIATISSQLTAKKCNWVVEDTAPVILGKAREATVADSLNSKDRRIKVSYLTEQTSHHPPVSAFWVDCPDKGISARGFDQLSAKFTGTSIRVGPGAHNLGIFITLQNRDNEEYQLTHPLAHLGGLLRGTLSVTVADTCFVTCPKTKLKVILHYLEEGWLSKSQNKVIGAIYKYNPESDKITRLRDVPEKDIIGRIEGCWKEQVYYTPVGDQVSSQNPPSISNLTHIPATTCPPHRPRPPLSRAKDHPAGSRPAPQREPPLLEGRHAVHPRQAVRAGYEAEAGAGGEAAVKGDSTQGLERGVAA